MGLFFNMDLKKLHVLAKVIQTGSFSKAAKELNYTPSGVLHMMNALEEEIGFPILIRNKIGISLNTSGEKIFPFVKALLASEEQLFQVFQHIEELQTGKVIIGSYTSIAASYLPKIIKRFHQDYPSIEIEIVEGLRHELKHWIETNAIDLALLSSDSKMDYLWHPLFSIPMVAVVYHEHPYANQAVFPIEQLSKQQLIMTSNGVDEDIIDVFRKHQIPPTIRFRTQENQTAISLIEQGLGIGVMNQLTTKDTSANIRVLPLAPPSFIDIGIATKKELTLSPAALMFSTYCQEEFKTSTR